MFLESLQPSEHVVFMRANADVLIDFIVDAFKQISERLKVDDEYRKRFQGEKAFEKHMFLIPLLLLCIKHLATELGKSEKLSQVVNAVRSFLVPGNERYIRASGMRVLLSWMKVRQYPPVLLTLFTSAIGLKELGLCIDQEAFPVHHGEVALFPSANTNSLDLLEDTLKLITFDPEPNQYSVKVLFDALRVCYFEKIYEQDSIPPQVQELIIK